MMRKIVKLVLVIGEWIIASTVTERRMREKIKRKSSMSDKYFQLFLMMNHWVRKKQEGKTVATYLEREGYKNIAIYGMNDVGETLLNELKNTVINVQYAIDRNADNILCSIPIVDLDTELEMVDAIVVTSVYYFDEIVDTLEKKIACPIISLEEVLHEI